MADEEFVDRLPAECSCYKLAPGILEFGQHHPDCSVGRGCICCGTTDSIMWYRGEHDLAIQTVCRPCKFGACEECR